VLAPALEYLPATQTEHTDESVAPTVAEKVPEAHEAQERLSLDARKEPAGQLVLQLFDPADENDESPHGAQLEADEAPVKLR